MVNLDLAGDLHWLKLTWSGLRPFLSRFFVRDDLACTRCEVSSIFFKDGIKVGFNLRCFDERNMLVCFFRLLTENVSGFTFITKFSKIFCVNIPGCVWNFMSDWQPISNWRWSFSKWIVEDFLTARYSFEALFTYLWNCGCCLRWRWCKGLLIEVLIWWDFWQNGKRNLEKIWLFLNWKTCSWHRWLLRSFRCHYEGPLTEALL